MSSNRKAHAEAEAAFHNAIAQARKKYAETVTPVAREAEQVLQEETEDALRIFKERTAQ